METIEVCERQLTDELVVLGRLQRCGQVDMLIRHTRPGGMVPLPVITPHWGNRTPPPEAMGFRLADDGRGAYLVVTDAASKALLARDWRFTAAA